MTTIVDTGHVINTEPELEFHELVERPKLSPAEILGNLYSWLEQDIATPVFDQVGRARKSGRSAADAFENSSVRQDALREVIERLNRLGAIDFVA